MINYKVSKLNSKTTDEQRVMLTRNLVAVKGIETVRLHPNRGEIALSFHQGATPSQAMIKKAVLDSGFSLGSVRK